MDIGERELLTIGNGVDRHIHDNREPRKGGLESVGGGWGEGGHRGFDFSFTHVQFGVPMKITSGNGLSGQLRKSNI